MMRSDNRPSSPSHPSPQGQGWFLSFLKNWTLPVAIAVGSISYFVFAFTPSLDAAGDALLPVFETLLPVTLFCTLFVTFSKVDFHLMRPCRWHLYILMAQLIIIGVLLGIIEFVPLGEGLEHDVTKWLLEAVLICVIAPCASASPVVTAKLGGNLTQMTTFVLISSVVVSVLIPTVFPILEPQQGMTFLTAFLMILQRMASVLLLPLVLGAVVRHRVKSLYDWFLSHPDLGFYCWCVSLSITAGITMHNIVNSHEGSHLLGDIALVTLLTAIVQFAIGRMVGKVVGEKVCTGQAMFQKNTGLAIWIAYTYLTPVASIGAGCYVLWQNIINSYELWQHRVKTDNTPS